jgi:hypothetical protein
VTVQVVAFIDAHRARFGVEPLCRVLTEHGCKIAPNTYWVARTRPPSAAGQRDDYLKGEIVPLRVGHRDVEGNDGDRSHSDRATTLPQSPNPEEGWVRPSMAPEVSA